GEAKMKTKMLVIGLAVGLVLGVVGTAAATSSPPTYKACASSSHVLAVEVAGKCPAHTSKGSINAQSLACSISAGINSNVNDGTIYWSGTPALNVQNSATPSTMVTFVNVGGSILNPILRCTDSNTQHT